MGAVMVPVWTVAVRKVTREVSRTRIPLLGIGAAFSFLVMMFNVPLPGGTTGHAVGGALLAVVLGPWSACISISIALLVQALMFGDGGILAFGANSFNMAFVIPFLGYFIFRAFKDLAGKGKGEYAGLVAGSYVSFVMAALAAAVELGVQPLAFRSAGGLPLYFPYPLSVSVPAMVVPHLFAGVGEAGFGAAIFGFLRRVSPASVLADEKSRLRWLYTVLAVLICLSPLGLLATGAAWGEWKIDWIRQALGYVPAGMQKGPGFAALFPAYAVKGMPGALGYVISAIAGASVLVILFKLFGLVRGNHRPKARVRG